MGFVVARRLAMLSAVLVLAARPAFAELKVILTETNPDPVPIAITGFFGETAKSKRMALDISRVLTADLERSGLFKPIDRRAFIQKTAMMELQPRFDDWKKIGALALQEPESAAQSR